jgi:endonuclease/exonuclease/phosphatase family metal-dependent hydrolase
LRSNPAAQDDELIIMKLWRSAVLVFVGVISESIVLRAETLTLATYNVENYGPADRLTEVGFRKDYPKPETEKAALRRVLRAIDADVVLVQEMGDSSHLEELRKDLAVEGLVYLPGVVLAGTDADRHVALLSKRPWAAITAHTDLTFRYFGKNEPVKRGLLEVRLQVAGVELVLFGLHLKSRYTDRADDSMSALRRAGEATAIRDRVLLRCPDPTQARFVIMGDFNDDKASKPLMFLQQRGKTQIADLIPARDSRGESWTHVYGKIDAYTRVDHALVSAALMPAVKGGAAQIYDGLGWREASDHRPVVVTLEWSDKK